MAVSIRSTIPTDHDHSASGVGGPLGGEVIGSTQVAALAITSAKLASSAVISGKIASAAIDYSPLFSAGVVDTVAIADGTITPTKVTTPLRTNIYIGDETETSSTSTARENVKILKIVKDATLGLDISKITWQLENKHSASGGTTNWILLMDTTGTMGSGTMVGATYILQTGSTAVVLTTGTHTIDLGIFTTAAGTAYNRLFELYAYT